MPRKSKQNNELTPVMLPKELVDAVSDKLSTERGVEIETYLGIYLRMMLKCSKAVLGLNDEMPFGKYRGEKIEHITRIDPAYVVWLITQDGRTKFDADVVMLANEMSTKG